MFKTLSRITLILLTAAALASAGLIGSWQVDQGPSWSAVPPAYTGQEAAALLFGGSPSDYWISTSPNFIDHLAWVSTWGGACGGTLPCGTKVAEDFKVSTGGLYASPGDTSAYVWDWAQGSTYINYAFSADSAVPEPGSFLLLGAGLAAVALRMRRARR